MLQKGTLTAFATIYQRLAAIRIDQQEGRRGIHGTDRQDTNSCCHVGTATGLKATLNWEPSLQAMQSLEHGTFAQTLLLYYLAS